MWFTSPCLHNAKTRELALLMTLSSVYVKSFTSEHFKMTNIINTVSVEQDFY